MKNLNKRTKMILTIVGIIVVAAISVGVVLDQMSGGELSGTANLVISPSNPTLIVGTMSYLSPNSLGNCVWYTSDKTVVSFDTMTVAKRLVRIQANQPGQVTIRADCGAFGINKVSTTVTVVSESTIPAPDIWLGPDNVTRITGEKVLYILTNLPVGYTCQTWASNMGELEIADDTRSMSLYTSGHYGDGYVSTQCDTPSGAVQFRTNLTLVGE